MNKEDAEDYAKYLAGHLERKLADFLQKHPIEKLEIIQRRVFNRYNPTFNSFMVDLVECCKKNEDEPIKPLWNIIEHAVMRQLETYYRFKLPDILSFCIIQFLLDSPDSTLTPGQMDELKERYKITPKTLQDELIKRHKGLLLNPITRGGKKEVLNDHQKFLLMSSYNRYLIVIQNARRDLKSRKRMKKFDSRVEEEIRLKYAIPEHLIASAFSFAAPSEIALDWAVNTISINLEAATANKLISKLNNYFKNKRNLGLIIDVDFSSNMTRIYGVHADEKQKIEKLKYTPVEKPSVIDESEFPINNPESYLVGSGKYRLPK